MIEAISSLKIHTKILLVTVTFLVISTFTFVNAQNNTILFNSLSSHNKLSQNTVNAILEDKTGFLWFGTEDGLNMYDGYRYRVFKQEKSNAHSISNNIIWTLYEDKDSALWIGTFNGLNYYNRETGIFTSYLHNPDDSNSISNNHILSITEDHLGDLWIGTNNGLNRFNKKTHTVKRYIQDNSTDNSLKGNVTNSILFDHLGILWIGTDKGVNVFDHEKESFSFYQIHNVPENYITTIFEDKNGTLWVGTRHLGLFQFNRKKETFIKINLQKKDIPLYITDISEDAGDNIWIGTNTGLFKIENETGNIQRFKHDPFDPNSIGGNHIRSVYSAKNNFLLIGTSDAGLSLINPYKNRFHHISPRYNDPNSIVSNRIRCFAEYENNTILVGTRKGLGIYSPQKNRYLPLPAKLSFLKNSYSITSIYRSKFNSDYYIGTENNGIYFYSSKNTKSSRFLTFDFNGKKTSKYKVYWITEDKSGELWIGTDGNGVIRYNPKNNKTVVYENEPGNPKSISNNRATCFMEDSTGKIWIGTAGGGINIFDRETNKFIRQQSIVIDTTSHIFSFILSLHEDSAGNIWIGTLGHGLLRYEKNSKQFKLITSDDGLPDDIIYGILEDSDGALWLSHNMGITCYDYTKNSFTNFDVRDGLQENEFNSNAYLKTENGTFLFGGNNGFNIFKPEEIVANQHIPNIIFTDLRINNKSIKAGINNGRLILEKSISTSKKIYLLHSDQEISIEFTALDFSVPQKNRFRYKLNDDNWVDLGNENTIKFHKLQAGETTLRVIGSNNDGLWNEQGAVVTFIVTPPFYQTVSFKSLMLLLIFTLVYFIYYLRTRSLKKQHKELQLLLETKTQQIKNQRDDLATKNEELALINRDIILERDKTLQIAKKLEEANKAKLQFFTNISHEFRTPLTLILTPIENFLNNPNDYKFSNIVTDYKLIQRNANKLLRLIDHLLQFRKFTTNQVKLAVTQNNLNEFIKNQASLFSSLAEQKHINFQIEYTTSDVQLWFDQEHIEKVLSNLLSNSFKYTHENGEIVISIGYPTESMLNGYSNTDNINPKKYACFYVRDTGIGIPDEEQKNIFKRFYKTKGNAQSGIGIGLHLVTSIIESHSGKIYVKSTQGEGSTFLVLLKTGNKHFNDNEINTEQQYDNTTIREQQEKDLNDIIDDEPFEPKTKIEKLIKNDMPTLLLVEDNKELRKYISKNLEDEYNIYEATTGEEALEILKDINPEITISDVMLPGELNGFALTEFIKSDLSTSHIPVILLTALSGEDQKIIGLEKGADVYLTKPFRLRELKAHLKSLMQSREAIKKKFREHAFLGKRELKISDQDKVFIQKIIQIIETNLSNPDFAVPALCEAVNMSHNKLYRKIKNLTDMTIKDFIQGVKLKTAAQLLVESEKNISEVAYEVGFSDPNYFGKCFKSQFGKSPSDFIKSKMHPK